jgi:hypothetical protein
MKASFHIRALLFSVVFACFSLINAQQYKQENDTRIDTLGFSTDTRLKEISGLLVSRKNPDTFWVHNDSGDAPVLYALRKDMTIKALFEIEGATHTDWEDIAQATIEGKNYLFIGDIGDNRAARKSITVYQVEEPALDTGSPAKLKVYRTIELVYEDGARDAEALLYDSRTNELILVTKRDEKARVYSAQLDQITPEQTTTLTFEGTLQLDALKSDLPPMRTYLNYITAADQHEDGSMLLKNYFRVWRYTNSELKPLKQLLTQQKPEQLPYLLEQQGEAIAFDLDSNRYYTTSECADDGTSHIPQPLYRYTLDASRPE